MARLPEPRDGSIAFDVLAEIASGTTARVDLCRITEPPARAGELIAVKRLHPHIAEDQQFADMFFDEMWMTAALRHPNVVEVVGWGTDKEGTYLAVELVQGVSLLRLMKTVVDTGEVFSERMVVYVAECLCGGLSAAHALASQEGELLQLVHRDLTPGNILCGFQGELKIADFGLAKSKQRVTRTLTGLLKGNPQYMSPEQAKGEEIDRRTDLFALGVVLFELFAGQRPWIGKTDLQVMHEVQNKAPQDLFQLRPKIDKELVAIVSKCLEKNPADRFQTADEVRERFTEWLSVHGYNEDNREALGRFVRRNAMRQMRWFERAVAGDLSSMPQSMRPSARAQEPKPMRPGPAGSGGPGRGRPPVPRRSRLKLGASSAPASSTTAADAPTPIKAPPPPRLHDDDLDDDKTEVTDVASKVAELHAELTRDDGRAPAESGEWAEEVPTLVHRSKRRHRAAPPIVDEDSDARPTAVKRKLPPSPQVPRAPLYNEDDSEVPTVPLKGPRKEALNNAIQSALQRNAQQADARQKKVPGEVVPPHPSAPPPPQRDAVDAAQRFDQATLMGEADRLAQLASVLDEEATRAEELARARRAAARFGSEAATLAQEAVRAFATRGPSAASKLIEQARSVEASAMQQRPASPGSDTVVGPSPVSPEVGAAMLAGSGAAGYANGAGASVPPPSLASPSSVAPPSSEVHGADVHPRISALPPDVDLSRSSAGMDRPSVLDELFRAKLRPTVLGMPTPIALAIAITGVLALLITIIAIIV